MALLFEQNPEVAEAQRVLHRMDTTHRRELDLIREELKHVALSQRRAVSADDARAIMRRLHIELPNNNALGSLFLPACWVWTGERIKSATPGAHGNELKTWLYEPSQEH